MRRIIFLTGAAVLGLAALMWAAAPIGAQHGGHPPTHVAPPARVGSVHYGARPAPGRVGPAVWAGAVRSEHYAGPAFRGAYRNPYRDEYFRRFRPGYGSFLIGDASYYYYDDLPPDYQTLVINGLTYFLYDGVYYQPYIYGGQTVYMVVPTQ